MVILTSVRWHFIVVLICISLIVMLNIFSCAYWPSIYLLWRNVYSGPLLIFQIGCVFFVFCFFPLHCIICLYILEIKPLSVALFENIFLHFIGCLFFLVISCAVQKFVSLIRSYLFIYLFFCCLGRLT